MSIIYSNSAGQIKNLNRPELVTGSQSHPCLGYALILSWNVFVCFFCLTSTIVELAFVFFHWYQMKTFGTLIKFMYFVFQVWSEVNQCVLDYENRESMPKLAKLLKLLLWVQNELDQKKVKYPKMTDLSKGTIEEPK